MRRLPDPTACPLCGASQHQHCEMSDSFTDYPRDLGAKRRLRPAPTPDKINAAFKREGRRLANHDLGERRA
jgi:hypothetical protein